MKFQFVQTNDLLLTTHAGLTSVDYLLAHTNLAKRLNHTKVGDVKVPLHSHADIMKSYLGLLCQGKSDFDAIELSTFHPLTIQEPKSKGYLEPTKGPMVMRRSLLMPNGYRICRLFTL